MKFRLSYAAILSAMLLQSCGGGGLAGGSNKDTDTMTPTAGVEDTSARPRPPENAVVITTDQHYIYDVAKKPMLLRGITLDFGQNPTARVNGIAAIKSTGANVVRLEINEQTTDTQLEGALATVLNAGMVAIVTLTAEGTKLTCTEDSAYLLSSVDSLWLKKWIPILAEDRFQGNVMVNIANGWGATDIFNQDSLGYQEYIDTYKALIRKFRDAGFKLPLVIDAPSCGQDYNAFLNGRSRELMAADTAKNLIFAAHADGAKWNTSDKIVNAATMLYNEKVPFILTGITGSGVAGVDEAPVDHMDVINKSIGDVALSLSLPWGSATDTVAYKTDLATPLDLRGGAVLSTNVFLDKLYAEFVPTNSGNYTQNGHLTFAMYLKDKNGNALRIGSTTAANLRSNQWSKLSYTLPKAVGDIDPANYMNGATSFDLTAVSQVGIQVLANGKPADLKAPIKFDDLSILPGVPPMYVANFDSSTEDWTTDWTGSNVSQSNGALAIAPTSDQMTAVIYVGGSAAIQNVKFNRPLEITYRVFLPKSYAGQNLWGNIYGKFGPSWSWGSNSFPTWLLKAGEWVDVKTTLDFTSVVSADIINSPGAFGLQIGGYTMPNSDPILIDSISISDPNAKPTKTVTVSQYKATFSKGTEGFVNAGWDGGQAVLAATNGELQVTVPAGDKGAINKADVNAVAEIDLRGNVVVKAKLFVPADWAGKDYSFKFFMQDGNWHHYQYAEALSTDLSPGNWTSLEFKVTSFPDGFSRVLKPQMFGVQLNNMPGGTFKLDDIEIVGDTQVDDSQPIWTLNFNTFEQYDSVKFDFGTGSLTESAVATAKAPEWKIIPFGWTATSWIGNTGDKAALDISKQEGVVDLTARGEDIVNSMFGIRATSAPINIK